ncbi:hypothetical protein LXA43DRAFT_977243 [Ganoderma leucocontextum]|nr:hypothetical protein LXA43DRAFT_977243 [Ganoderma leucocontextum]
MVNSLAAAAEIGGPATCSSLMGYPDHYTNRKFRTVYWHSYVRKAIYDVPVELRMPVETRALTTEDSNTEQIMVGLTEDGVVPLTKTNDYVFRPHEYENLCLYDYLCRTEVRKLGKRQVLADISIPEDEQSTDYDNAYADVNLTLGQSSATLHSFLRQHPQYKSHGVVGLNDTSLYTVNFTGGLLPRPDKGNREEYALAMLVFFKPGGWRSGRDIVGSAKTWQEAFQMTTFASEHVAVMKNMMALYECLDARDDYSTQR